MTIQLELTQERAARPDGYVLASQARILPETLPSLQIRSDIARCFGIKRLNANSHTEAKEVFERVLTPIELGTVPYNPLNKLVFRDGDPPDEGTLVLETYPASWGASFILETVPLEPAIAITVVDGKTFTFDDASEIELGDYLRIDDEAHRGVFRITDIDSNDVTVTSPEDFEFEDVPTSWSIRRFNTDFTGSEPDTPTRSITLSRPLPSISPVTKVQVAVGFAPAIPARESATSLDLFRDSRLFQYFNTAAAVLHAQVAQQKYMQEYVKQLNYVMGEYGTFDLVTTIF